MNKEVNPESRQKPPGGAHASHGHAHTHAPATFTRAFAIGTILNLAFVIIEVVFGLHARSLALIADAGHNLGDVLGLVLAWIASVLARRRPTLRRTYGMRRSSILAALINAVILLITVGAIALEAIRRFSSPAPVAAPTIIIVATIGIVVNTVTALLFLAGRHKDINIRGAFLHMAADAAVSAAVVVSGIAIALTGARWLDPLMSLVIAVVITIGTWSLLRDSVNLALDAVPEGIDPRAVETYLADISGVSHVHDLHIWGMSTTEVALTAHLIKGDLEDEDTLIADTALELHERFGIEHTTIQIERGHRSQVCCSLISQGTAEVGDTG